MPTHSSIAAWEIPWTEEPGGYSPWGHKRVGWDLLSKQLPYIGALVKMHDTTVHFSGGWGWLKYLHQVNFLNFF